MTKHGGVGAKFSLDREKNKHYTCSTLIIRANEELRDNFFIPKYGCIFGSNKCHGLVQTLNPKPILSKWGGYLFTNPITSTSIQTYSFFSKPKKHYPNKEEWLE